MFATFASMKAEPWGVSQNRFDRFLGALEAHWGEGVLVGINAPSLLGDKAFVQWFGRLERASASPGAILALERADYESDVRHVLPSIRVPTLILHRRGDSAVPVAVGHYLAQNIAGAKYVELQGEDHLLQALDQDQLDLLLDEIEELITGARHRPDTDRVLATVMFTDIVRSTERAAELGDARWRELLSNYYAVLRKELTAFRGREVNTAGDGLLATFDGPGRAIRCACSVRDRLGPLGLQVRTGLHTGECELIGDDVGGIAVHIAARVASTAEPDEVLVSSTVRDLVAGSGLRFADRGMHGLKGVPGEWRLFLVQ
jgi:class 3 adenylate cyclase